MRIVHIHYGKVNPDTLNGVSKAGHWMATYQTRLGHEVEVWGLAASMHLTPRPREYKMRLFPITRLRVVLSRELKTALAQLEPSAWVQFHSVFCPEFPSIARVLRKRGIRYGVTPHGGYAAGVMRKNPVLKRLYVALRERRYLEGASWLQAMGDGEVSDLRALAAEVMISLIPNGQSFDLIEGMDAAEMAAERPVFGFCGRMAMAQKGLDFLLQGFAAYKAKGGKGQLWLIGDGEDRAAVESLAATSGYQQDVKFFGAMVGAEKLEMTGNFDAFIHSSRWEGMPTACLEAAALGKALLVSRETNLAEYVVRREAGLLLDETSAAGVKRALERAQDLYPSGELGRMGDNARLMIENEFSWEENARAFVAAVAAAGAQV